MYLNSIYVVICKIGLCLGFLMT